MNIIILSSLLIAYLSSLSCEDNNGIVSNTECDANADDKFFLDAFRFQDQVPGDKVYFHATVIVCLASDGSSECQTECLVCTPPPPPAPGRKRRETVKESLQTTYYVKAGPYRVVDSTNKGMRFKNPWAGIDHDVRICRTLLK